MKKIINTSFLLMLGCWFLGSSVYIGAKAADDPLFAINDEDLKKLNLPDKEAQELKQFLSALETSLTPEQKKEYVEEQKRLEKKMEDLKLDPNNPDDWLKLINEEAGTPTGAKPQPIQPIKPEPAPRFQEEPRPLPEKISLAPTASPKAALSMLNEISKHYSSMRQKIQSWPALDSKLNPIRQELSELNYYLQVLRAQELTILLASKEFSNLYKKFESLHKGLIRYEPSLIARKKPAFIDEEDPYQVLELPYSASKEEIEARYKELSATRSPKALKNQLLKEKKYSATEREKILKVAQRTFNEITNSYKQLKDPKKRKELQDTFETEINNERSTKRSFDRVLDTLNTAIYGQGILRDIFNLLEKHKPQELEQMKAQVELEKKAYERSKEKRVVPQLPPRFMAYEPPPYEQFYQHMAQASYQRPQYPSRTNHMAAENHAPIQQPNGRAGTEQKPSPAKKEKDKEKEEEKKEKDKEKGSKPSEPIIRSKDVKKFSALNDVEEMLKEASKKKNKIQVTQVLRTGPGTGEGEEPAEPVKEEKTLDMILNDVDQEIAQEPEVKPEAPALLKQFYDENSLEKLGKSLIDIKKTVTQDGAKDAELKKAFTNEWKSKIVKHKDMINNWRHSIARVLDVGYRSSNNPVRSMNSKKMRKYNLDTPLRNPYDKPKPGAPKELGPEKDAVDLGHLRNIIDTLYKTFNEITTLLAQKAAVPKEEPEAAEASE